MLSRSTVELVVYRCSYRPGWQMKCVDLPGGLIALRVKDPDSPVWGREWVVMGHHDESDVVRTLFQAVGAVEEHERRELFHFDGVKVWDPHEVLVDP